MSKELFGYLSVVFASVGYGTYIWSIVRGKTNPHAFSWGVWSILMAIIFFVQLSKGAAAGAWVTGFSAAICVIITIFAVVRGEKNITRSDGLAFVGALATIPVWYFTHNPLGAVILATIIDAFAYYPTFRKSWHRPYEETPYLYMVDCTKWIVSFFALGNYSFTTLFYPLFCITANSSLAMLIFTRRIMKDRIK